MANPHDNDLGTLPFTGDVDGSFWLAGFRGSLSDTTTYEVRIGEQFYGDHRAALTRSIAMRSNVAHGLARPLSILV